MELWNTGETEKYKYVHITPLLTPLHTHLKHSRSCLSELKSLTSRTTCLNNRSIVGCV
jgi:hypothetical protein